jgi:hypothetical protein
VFDPWLRAERERERARERERESTKAAVLSPACRTHQGERERVVEGPWARARGPRARDDEDGGPWPDGPNGPAARALLLFLRRSPDPCGDGRRRGRADRSSVRTRARASAARHGPANPFTVAVARAPIPLPSMMRRASYPGMDRGACDIWGRVGRGRCRVGPWGI